MMAKVLSIALQLSVVLLVVAIGLGTRWSDVTYLFRRPVLLAKSILARNVIVPLTAMIVITSFRLEWPVAAAMAVLSVTAVPPVLPSSQRKAGGREPYVIGLFASQSVLAIVLIPASLVVFNAILGTQARLHFSAGQVAAIVGKLVLAPFAVGLLVHRLWPAVSGRVGTLLSRTATLTLAIGALVLVVVSSHSWIALIGNGSVFALVLFVLGALVAGHVLGGPREEDRTALALAAASSHPGLAMAIVRTNAPEQVNAVFAAVLLYLLIRVAVTQLYARRRHGIKSVFLWRMGGDRRANIRPGRDRRQAVG